MKARIFAGIICAGFLFAQNGFAQDITPPKRKISLDEAVTLALNNNLNLQSGKVTLDKKKRPSDLAWNQFLPTVGVSGALSAANETTKTTNPLTGEVQERRWGMNMGINVQWQGLNFALAEGVIQLKKSYEAGAITYQKAKSQLERDIRKLYNSLLFAQESLKVQEASLTLAEEQVRTATANYRAGLSPELNLLQARLNRDNLIPDVDQTRNNIKASMANLAMLLGIPYNTEFELEALPKVSQDVAIDTQKLINEAAANKIDIQELRASITATRHARNAMRLQLWTPSLGIGWSLSPTFQGDPFVDEWGGDSWVDRGSISVSLSWSLNGLFPWTTQSANLRDMEDDLRNLDINLAQSIRATELEVYNTIFSIEQARESTTAQQKTVALAERTYKDTLSAFRAGLRDFIEVQNVEQQLRQARLGVLQQQMNYISGLIDLEYSIGVPFGTLTVK